MDNVRSSLNQLTEWCKKERDFLKDQLDKLEAGQITVFEVRSAMVATLTGTISRGTLAIDKTFSNWQGMNSGEPNHPLEIGTAWD